jgi:hypothetical protein
MEYLLIKYASLAGMLQGSSQLKELEILYHPPGDTPQIPLSYILPKFRVLFLFLPDSMVNPLFKKHREPVN